MIVIILPYDILSLGHLWSQVVNPFAFLASKGLSPLILTLADVPASEQASASERLGELGLRCQVVSARGPRLWQLWRLGCAARTHLRGPDKVTFYARDIWGGLIALIARSGFSSAEMVYDLRGAIYEELVTYRPGWKSRCKATLLRAIERILLRKADRIAAVSKTLSEYARKEYGVAADVIIPCCVKAIPSQDDRTRQRVRTEIGFGEEDFVFVYSGGLSRWQLFEQTVQCFAKLKGGVPAAKLLILTRATEEAASIARRYVAPGDLRLLSLSQEEVVPTLQAADAAFLLREDNTVNNVAFPIKFAEYLSAGLPVISTKGLLEVSQWIEQSELGIVVNPIELELDQTLAFCREVSGHRSQWKARLQEFAESHCRWDAYEAGFRALYRDLGN